MCGVLALLFIVVPAVEIYLIIEVGSRLGAGMTLAVIITTGIIGAALAQKQGLAVMNKLRGAMGGQEPVARPMVEAALVLVAGVMLLTPGFMTDVVGFGLLIPPLRQAVAGYAATRYSAHSRVVIGGGASPWPAPDHESGEHDYEPPPPGVIDAEAVEVEDDESMLN